MKCYPTIEAIPDSAAEFYTPPPDIRNPTPVPVREALDVLRRDDSPDEDALLLAQQNYNAAVANVAAAQAAVDEARAGANSGQRTAAFGGVSAATAQRDAAQAS